MPSEDFFAGALTSAEQLREIYGASSSQALRKQTDHLGDLDRALIAASGLVLIGSADQDGRCDVSPRGGPPGFVTVLNDRHIAIPDATGNKRIDSLQNVVETGQAAVIFLIPGRGQTLRVNGQACVTSRLDILENLTAVGKPPRTALVVRTGEVYTHCPKAFVRSKTWNPESWPDLSVLPSSAEVTHAHLADPAISVVDIEQGERESLLYRLD